MYLFWKIDLEHDYEEHGERLKKIDIGSRGRVVDLTLILVSDYLAALSHLNGREMIEKK